MYLPSKAGNREVIVHCLVLWQRPGEHWERLGLLRPFVCILGLENKLFLCMGVDFNQFSCLLTCFPWVLVFFIIVDQKCYITVHCRMNNLCNHSFDYSVDSLNDFLALLSLVLQKVPEVGSAPGTKHTACMCSTWRQLQGTISYVTVIFFLISLVLCSTS